MGGWEQGLLALRLLLRHPIQQEQATDWFVPCSFWELRWKKGIKGGGMPGGWL